MGKILAVAAIAALVACAPNRYAVVDGEGIKSTIAMPSGEKLVDVRNDGSWVWHKSPEEVVTTMAQMFNQQSQIVAALSKRLSDMTATAALAAPVQSPAALPRPSLLPKAAK
jgi:ribulose-5-phosphate 4-epimerase/fuculose-1-phosphate aldolase